MSAATRTVRVDGDVFAELQRLARAYGMGFSSPNAVLRRALSIGDTGARAERKLWAVVEMCLEDLRGTDDVGLSLHGSREAAEAAVVAGAQADWDELKEATRDPDDLVDGRPTTLEEALEFLDCGESGSGEIDVREVPINE